MKKTIFISLLALISTLTLADIELDTIPHYKIYPRTPIVNYDKELLDFYSVKDAYGEFSNFALFPLILDGKDWTSSEHYFQAQKFLDPEIQEKIRDAKTPYDAAVLARAKGMPVREDWKEVRDEIMERVVREKFTSYSVLRELLLSTNSAKIYEHTKNDCYWADCGDRTGKNKLGHILEKIRQELKNKNK